jgi:hypothetical protein
MDPEWTIGLWHVATVCGAATFRAAIHHPATSALPICAFCDPSYSALEACTGLCRQSICTGLRRLEQSGTLKITRRLVREVVDGILVTRQGSNLYEFASDPTGRVAPEGRVYDAGTSKNKQLNKQAFRSKTIPSVTAGFHQLGQFLRFEVKPCKGLAA